jgi:hypothetical protein
MLRQFLVGGLVSVCTIVVHALVMGGNSSSGPID